MLFPTPIPIGGGKGGGVAFALKPPQRVVGTALGTLSTASPRESWLSESETRRHPES